MLPLHWNFEARRLLLAKPRCKSTFRFSAGPFPGVLKDTWHVIWQITTLVVPHLSVPPQPVHGSPLPAEPLDRATWAQCPVDDREVLQTDTANGTLDHGRRGLEGLGLTVSVGGLLSHSRSVAFRGGCH